MRLDEPQRREGDRALMLLSVGGKMNQRELE